MNKILFYLLLIQTLTASTAFSQTTGRIDITNENVYAYSISRANYYPAPPYYSLDETRMEMFAYITSKEGFAEFDLTPWFNLNMPSSAITDVEFTIESHEDNQPPGPISISLYDMLDLENGSADEPLSDQYSVLSASIGNFIWNGTDYGPVFPYYVTDEFLTMNVFDAVLNDISSSQNFTGFVLTTNVSAPRIATNKPVLSIYYDTAAVPEPFSTALFVFGTFFLNLFRRKLNR